ncbi:MAG: polymorphic toxin type 35 domain-containing protein [Bacteroidota bacterium]
MITKQIKYLLAGLLLFLGTVGELQAQACLVETPMSWTISNGVQHIEAEALPADADGYLDFVWDGNFIYYGFYKTPTPNFTFSFDCGVYLSGSNFYIRHNNSWTFLGAIASAGDHIRLAKEGSNYVVYHNGAALFTGAVTAGLAVYPYVRDDNGLQRDRLEYFKKPPVYTPEWIANSSSYHLASEVLGRGQDGFIEHEYNSEYGVMIGFSKSKSVASAEFAARLYYSPINQRMYMYLNGFFKGSLSVSVADGDKITLERKGSMIIYSANNVKHSYAIDGNLDLHPWTYEYTSGSKAQVRVSFDTRGGVCQDYFDRLPSYVNVSPDPYYPPSYTDEGWNIVHTFTYNGEGEGPCHVISESKSYANRMGYGVQQQTKDYLTGKVWATETIYDYLGRPALSTLSAPTGLDVLQYHTSFTRDALGNNYDLDDFDRTFNSSGVQTADQTNNPNPVGTQANTLGAWYSSANTEEPWQATSQYPYTRTEYSTITGAPRRIAGAGDAQRMGNDHEVVSFSMRTGSELRYVIGQKKPICLLAGTAYDEGNVLATLCSSAPTGFYNLLTKKVTADQDGKEMVMFYDNSGNVIAEALSGRVNGSNRELQSTQVSIPAGEYRDIHVTDADNSINISGGGVFDIYDLSTDVKMVSGSSANITFLSPGVYRVASLTNTITLSYDLNYYNFSLSIYDKQNQLVATVAPKDVVHSLSVAQHSAHTFYRYNSYGQLIWEESPDAGRVSYLYRKDGQLRFSENEQQDADNDFSYIIYDELGRPIESGEYTSTPGSFGNLGVFLDIDSYPSNNSYKQEEIYTTYEVSDPVLPSNREQQFVEGQVAKISNDDGTTWYSYDQEGRLAWTAQSVSGLSEIKYSDFKYDLLGSVTEVTYQEGQSDEFRHHYAYNSNSKMTSVSTRTDGDENTVPDLQAQYQYTLLGAMDRVVLAEGLERKHYVYTLHGNLKAINPKDMVSADINSHRRTFSMALDYYLDDYVAANGSRAGKVYELLDGSSPAGQANYSGLIGAQRWKARAAIGGADYSGSFAYGYLYNHRNEFFGANFGQVNSTSLSNYDGAFSGMNDYKVAFSGDGYDENGNITRLLRYGQGGTLIDNLYYIYHTTGPRNRLKYIADFAGTHQIGDLATQGSSNYDYDLNGNMTDDISEDNKLVYNSYGLVTEVRSRASNHLKVRYVYGPEGQRVKKFSYGANSTLTKTTWYFKGPGRQSIYEQESGGAITLEEVTINGLGRLGKAFYSGGAYNFQYELKDHLGNVRAVIEKGTNGDADVLYYADYYPYGWTLPGRHGGVSRYGYQGDFAEKDEEVGWNAFELRMYDGRLSRWTATDPYQQYWSPYLSMGNDPINGIDPDGGFKTRFGAWMYKTFNGGGSIVDHDGVWAVIQNERSFMIGNQAFMDYDLVTQNNWGQSAGAFTLGLANSFSSNNGIGPRLDPNTNAYYYGQRAGDILSILQGVGEMALGTTMTTGGTTGAVLSAPTGVGVVAGVSVASAGVVFTAHGEVVAAHGVHNLLFAKGPTSTSGKSRVSSAMGKINSNNINKIMADHHAWKKLFANPTWAKIKPLIEKTMLNGVIVPYKSVSSRVMQHKGFLIQVTYKEVKGQLRISDAWIITRGR